MITAAIVAFVVSVVFAAVGPRLARRLPPAMSTRLLVSGSVVVAAATGLVLAMAAFTLIGQLPEIADAGRWSARAVAESSPVPPIVAGVCGLLAVVAASRAGWVLTRRVVAFVRAERDVRGFGTDPLMLVDCDRLDAFSTPGVRGRIVVTTGLRRALSTAEWQAVLAHEQSHLTHRHAWWLLAADVAAAANPLLGPIARAMPHVAERWADEDAAEVVRDRRTVARAVGRAALLRHQLSPRPLPVPHAIGGDVPDRVRALLAPKPRHQLRHLAVLAALLLVVTGGSALVQERGRELFVHASITHQQH